MWLLFGQTSFNLAFCCYLKHQFFNWASVPGGRFSNSPTSQSPNVSCHFMKSLIFISFFLILTLLSYSQTKVTEYYENGRIKLESSLKNNTYDSTFISYYENRNKMTEGIYKKVGYKTSSMEISIMGCGTGRDTTKPFEGIKNGQWKQFYENGQLKSIENFFGDIQVGQSNFYDSLGNLLENKFYNAGRLIQKQEYFINKVLEKFTNRSYIEIKNKGEKSYTKIYFDKVFEYYLTGELKSIATVNEDEKRTDKFIEYWENGFVKKEGEYKDGVKNGIFREYHQNGNTKFEGIIKNDTPQEKQYFSNDKGKNIKIETWRKGKLLKTEEKSGS